MGHFDKLVWKKYVTDDLSFLMNIEFVGVDFRWCEDESSIFTR
jgi:hypothetical protein